MRAAWLAPLVFFFAAVNYLIVSHLNAATRIRSDIPVCANTTVPANVTERGCRMFEPDGGGEGINKVFTAYPKVYQRVP